MDQRQNLCSLYRRQGIHDAPVEFHCCESLKASFQAAHPGQDMEELFGMSYRNVGQAKAAGDPVDWQKHLPFPLVPGAWVTTFGGVWEPGDGNCFHLRHLPLPLAEVDSMEVLQAWPWPKPDGRDWTPARDRVAQIHARGLAAHGSMECTIWESAWYARGMETLLMDMCSGESGAEVRAAFVLDRVSAFSVESARGLAAAGVDILGLGDDIGMQSTPLMDPGLWRAWLKPRLKMVIDAARAVNPEIIIHYHSCGYVLPFSDDLIAIGVDVLNPVQPESMDVDALIRDYGERLSCSAGLGTQTTMPFGSPAEVRARVHHLLDLAGRRGGFFVKPTHLLEPEVSWANIKAYVAACREWRSR